MMTTCPYCATEFVQHEGKGRPSKFCGDSCRRCAETSLRRLVRRLEGFDAEIIGLEREAAGFGPYGPLDERRQKEAAEKLRFVFLQRDRIVGEYESLVRRYEGRNMVSVRTSTNADM
jgi:hypothetical protein